MKCMTCGKEIDYSWQCFWCASQTRSTDDTGADPTNMEALIEAISDDVEDLTLRVKVLEAENMQLRIRAALDLMAGRN